jgi:hypothetical protein
VVLSGTRAAVPDKADGAELAGAIRKKDSAPMFNAVMRVVVKAPTMARATNLVNRVVDAWKVLDAPGVSVERRLLPSAIVAGRVYRRALPLTVWPMRLSAAEAAGFVLPIGDVQVPGLKLGGSRQLPPPEGMPRKGVVLAESNWPGMAGRPLALRTADFSRHLHVIGPSGVGKSTLLANLTVQHVDAGFSTILVDPKADLVNDVLARVAQEQAENIIVLDPSVTDEPIIGFNVLRASDSEHVRELVVDQVLHVFGELWGSSFLPRTNDVLRAALLTLTHTTAPNGAAFTICELPELLTNTAFRRFVTVQPTVPDSVRGFWAQFEALSTAERVQVIGPSMSRLRTLTTRTALRLSLGQSDGLDVNEVLRSGRSLLVPLSKGTVGSGTAQIIGSLLTVSVWNAVLARSAVAQEQRRPVWLVLDEFQETLRLGGDITDMLATARSYQLGLVLAHQYLDQLPRPVQQAVLGTVGSQVVFRVEPGDARVLGRRFAPSLSALDLSGQTVFEVAIRPCVGNVTQAPTTGVTRPLSEPSRSPNTLARQSRRRYGMPRAEIEAGLRARIEMSQPTNTKLGRTRRGGAS